MPFRGASPAIIRPGIETRSGKGAMTAFQWILLIVVVFVIPLTIAVVVTLWTLEMARKRNKKNRQDVTVRRVTTPAIILDPGEGMPSRLTGDDQPPVTPGTDPPSEADHQPPA